MSIETKEGANISLRPHRLQSGKLAALDPNKPRFWRDIDLAGHLHIVDPNDPTKVLRDFTTVPFTSSSGKATRSTWGRLMQILEAPGDLPDGTISVTDPKGSVETHNVRRVSYGSPAHQRLLEDVRDQTMTLSRLDLPILAWLIEDMGVLHIKTTTSSSTRAHEEWLKKTAGGELGILASMVPGLRAGAGSSSSGGGSMQQPPPAGLAPRYEASDDSDYDPNQQTSPISLRLAAEWLAAKHAGCAGAPRPATPPARGAKSPGSVSPEPGGKNKRAR